MEYSFEETLKLGKEGEKVVIEFLRSKIETEDVINLSENKRFQNYGVDGLWVYTSRDTQLLRAIFFDVKTDFNAHRTGKLFIEISSSENKDGGILSTKAEYFFYYDPIVGRLYELSIYAIKRWYDSYGISMKHESVHNKGYETSGIFVDINYLKDRLIITDEFRVGKIHFENISETETT